jgi:nicotinamide-nucleotide amidase
VTVAGLDQLWDLGAEVGALLKARGETVAVAEGSAGGLVSAALLSVPGASAYYLGGSVVYTAAAHKAFLLGAIEVPAGLRGATEGFARYLAEAVAVRVGATWGVAEAGAAGPPNPYGDPAGHCWVAVHGPSAGQQPTARHLLTGLDDRRENMVAFAVGALQLLAVHLEAAPS